MLWQPASSATTALKPGTACSSALMALGRHWVSTERLYKSRRQSSQASARQRLGQQLGTSDGDELMCLCSAGCHRCSPCCFSCSLPVFADCQGTHVTVTGTYLDKTAASLRCCCSPRRRQPMLWQLASSATTALKPGTVCSSMRPSLATAGSTTSTRPPQAAAKCHCSYVWHRYGKIRINMRIRC